MSKFLSFAVVLLLTLSVVTAAPRRPNTAQPTKPKDDKWWTNSKATLLSSKSFDFAVGKDKYAVVQFCATFSKECEKSTPEYDKLAELYSGDQAKRNDVSIARIDGWTFNSLSQTYGVKNFPNLRFFGKGDNVKNEEYTGEQTAEKMSEWIENLIKTTYAEKAPEAAKPAEEKKVEEPKKETPPPAAEPPKENAAPAGENKQAEKPAEPAKPAEEKKAEEPKKETPPPAQEKSKVTEEDIKKEFKLVLNTTLLQGQFDEVQNQLNKLKESFEKSIVDNFQKVEALSRAFEAHTRDFSALTERVKGHGDSVSQIGSSVSQIGTRLSSMKDEIHQAVTGHAEKNFNSLKDTVTTIKNKVHEPVAAPQKAPEGPGFMHNLIWMVIGGAIGGIAVFFLSAGGNKKRRSMLD